MKEDLLQWVTANIMGGQSVPKSYNAEIALKLSSKKAPANETEALTQLSDSILLHWYVFDRSTADSKEKLRKALQKYEEKHFKITKDLSFHQYFILYIINLSDSAMFAYVKEQSKNFDDYAKENYRTYLDNEDVYEGLYSYEELFLDYYLTKKSLEILL